MKTLQELYNEVLKNEVLKKAFAESMQGGKAADFLKANGCEASTEELAAFLKEQQARAGTLSDDELENVSGGCNRDEALLSVFTVGLACAAIAIVSKSNGDMEGPEGQILCGDSISER